jgi:hypothetical protein
MEYRIANLGNIEDIERRCDFWLPGCCGIFLNARDLLVRAGRNPSTGVTALLFASACQVGKRGKGPPLVAANPEEVSQQHIEEVALG